MPIVVTPPPPPEPLSESVTVPLTKSDRRWLEEQADREGVAMSAIMRRALAAERNRRNVGGAGRKAHP